MLNFGASKPRVKGGPGSLGPPGSAPGTTNTLINISAKQCFEKLVDLISLQLDCNNIKKNLVWLSSV